MSIDSYGGRNSAGQGVALRLNISPQPKAQRAREPVTRSRGLVRGQFSSTKMKRMIAWESQLEQKACYHFEYSPAVLAFSEQPETLQFPYHDGMCRYTPDFQLTLHSGEIIYVEIKPLSKLRSPKVLERLQLASQFLAARGYTFIVLTDEELNFPNRIRNFSILRPYLRFDIPTHITQQATAWIKQKSNQTLQDLNHFCGLQATAFALLAQLHIRFDFDEPLSKSSVLFTLPTGDHYETCLFTYRTGPDFKQCAVPSDPNVGGWSMPA